MNNALIIDGYGKGSYIGVVKTESIMGKYQHPTALNLSPKLKEEIREVATALSISDHRMAIEAIRFGLDHARRLIAEGNPPAFPPVLGGHLGSRNKKPAQPKPTATAAY